ncbi:hypothetical protein [Polyangium spumosum]|uniref:TonB C-terminal domain-containing protein n=1 Tax=Polyangium spumosum TaxID=889282 RepID=A0A6N7Q129_9BACT|nr:hypothetical protein [Polyangium spumosum]MRG98182.1 hypothetical protein [Polyangium spumosum]
MRRADRRPRLLAVWFELLDAANAVLASGVVTLPPPAGALVQRAQVRCDPQVVRNHPVWRTRFEVGQSVALRWRVQLVDRRGNVLDAKTLDDEMYAD